MSSSENDLTDFRSRAVAASEAIQRHLPTGVSPERGGISCCQARQPSLSRFRTPIKISAVVSAILGLSAVALGGAVGFLLERHIFGGRPGLVAIASCSSIGGILILFFPTFFERRIVRQHLSQRSGSFGSGTKLEGIHVSLEYAPTYGTLKILAEDVGLLYVHPEAHYVKIDGLSYEYIIQSKDVVRLSLHSNRKSVLLSYAVGAERLDLAIVPRSLRAELKRQTLGESQSLFAMIQEALKPDGGPEDQRASANASI